MRATRLWAAETGALAVTRASKVKSSSTLAASRSALL